MYHSLQQWLQTFTSENPVLNGYRYTKDTTGTDRTTHWAQSGPTTDHTYQPQPGALKVHDPLSRDSHSERSTEWDR